MGKLSIEMNFISKNVPIATLLLPFNISHLPKLFPQPVNKFIKIDKTNNPSTTSTSPLLISPASTYSSWFKRSQQSFVPKYSSRWIPWNWKEPLVNYKFKLSEWLPYADREQYACLPRGRRLRRVYEFTIDMCHNLFKFAIWDALGFAAPTLIHGSCHCPGSTPSDSSLLLVNSIGQCLISEFRESSFALWRTIINYIALASTFRVHQSKKTMELKVTSATSFSRNIV